MLLILNNPCEIILFHKETHTFLVSDNEKYTLLSFDLQDSQFTCKVYASIECLIQYNKHTVLTVILRREKLYGIFNITSIELRVWVYH